MKQGTENNTSENLTARQPEKAVSQIGNIVLSIIMAALGLTFISLCDRHEDISSTILTLGGIAFVLPGVTVLLSLLIHSKARREKPTVGSETGQEAALTSASETGEATAATSTAGQKEQSGSVMNLLTVICGIAAVALGIVILVAPDVFRPLLVYLFGGLLILSAAWQFNLMVRRNRATLYPVWLEVAPILIVVLGVVMMTLDIFKGDSNEKALVLTAGIGFTLFGLIGLSISYIAIKARNAAKKAAKAAAKATATDGQTGEA